MVLETHRLKLREMCEDDFFDLCRMLRDPEVMYAYEHAFSETEAREWLERQIKRYQKYGFGLWAVILKDTGKMIGQCGLTMQDADGKEVMEIGYLLCKEYWRQGYASEAAAACREYAFGQLEAEEVYSIIRDSNHSSRKVAKRCGMKKCGIFTKHYYQTDMPHCIYRITRAEWEKR